MMNKMKISQFWVKFRSWVHHHRTTTYVIVGSTLILIAGVATFLILSQKPTPMAELHFTHKTPKPPPAPKKYYSLLTGEEVASQADLTSPVTAIMIENSPDARPQSGLKQAGVVFEAIAEGGITRFLTLHQQDKPQLIGPVRSVRIYYVNWLAAFNASIAHVGGSAAALTEVRNGTYRDLDEFFNGAYYWRATDRYAPHNVYTSFAKLDALNAAKGYTSSTFTGFSRIDAAPSKTPTATHLTINFGSAWYNTSYVYNATTNQYTRYIAGVPSVDREDGQIAPDVVVAMHVDETTILQDGDRESITAVGSGQATIFQDGTAQNVIWHKTSPTSQITFTDATTGKDAPLIRGQTWIAAVPNNEGSVSWQ